MTYALGRHVNHDERSLEFPAAVADTHRPVSWAHYGPILDQGQVGSCTGNAMAQALNTAPLWTQGRAFLTEDDALKFYSAATHLDHNPGVYPPTDTGSNGLSVAKAAKQAGYISAYHHAFGLEHALGALQLGPLLVGISWYQDMFTPDANGFVHPGGQLAGGHEICAIGDSGTYVEFLNSWGEGWGLQGRFRLSYADFDALLKEHGDVTVPVK